MPRLPRRRAVPGVPQVCRVASAEFEPALTAAGAARSWVVEHLVRWELDTVTDIALLLTSELVANAVVHARSAPAVSLAVGWGSLEAGVSDRDPRLGRTPGAVPPAVAGRVARGSHHPDRDMADSGRGLSLLDALADEWGTARLSRGKQVWFRLAVPGWLFNPRCSCAEDGGTELASGRPVTALPEPWERP